MEELSQKVLPLFESGELTPISHETYPLSESKEAHEIMEANENIGKIILTLD